MHAFDVLRYTKDDDALLPSLQPWSTLTKLAHLYVEGNLGDLDVEFIRQLPSMDMQNFDFDW